MSDVIHKSFLEHSSVERFEENECWQCVVGGRRLRRRASRLNRTILIACQSHLSVTVIPREFTSSFVVAGFQSTSTDEIIIVYPSILFAPLGLPVRRWSLKLDLC